MTKLFVGLGGTGSKDGRTNSIEIIDLQSASTKCQSLPNFPVALAGSFGGLGFQDKLMISGGQDYLEKNSNKWFSLKGNHWTSLPNMNTSRSYAAVSPSPYPSKLQRFFVTGSKGKTDLNSVEVLTEQGWTTLPQSLPVTIRQHCSVLVNSTTVMVIGGFQNNVESSNTYFFNTENEIWTAGPHLKNGRRSHSCGKIRKNNQSQEFSIIVAGGNYLKTYLTSVEILDLGSNEWMKGPDLPIGIDTSQMVEDHNGGVVLVGGYSVTDGYLDTLFLLPHGGADAEWIKMNQTLKVGRNSHVAFLVPDNMVDCS